MSDHLLTAAGRTASLVVAAVLVLSGCRPEDTTAPGPPIAPPPSRPPQGQASYDSLPGAPGDPALGRIPDRGWTELQTGVVSRRVLVIVAPGASVGQVNGLLRQTQARIGGGDPATGLLIVDLPDTSSAAGTHAVAAGWRSAGAFSAVAPEGYLGVDALPRDPNVAAWSWDLAATGGNWGLEYSRFPQAWNVITPFTSKLNMSTLPDVVVMDDGFQSHEDLTSLRLSTVIQPTIADSHGTHVAGTIGATWGNQVGVDGAAPVGGLIGVTVRSPTRREAPFSNVIATFRGILANNLLPGQRTRVRVINSSLGCQWWRDTLAWRTYFGRQANVNPNTDAVAQTFVQGQGQIVARYVHQARAAGIVVVSSAGNNGTLFDPSDSQWSSPLNWAARHDGAVNDAAACGGPCRTDAVLVVEAHSRGVRPQFSDVNGDVSAPGVGILSTVGANGYAAWGGTSMAAPHVSALAALLFAFDDVMSPTDVATLIRAAQSTRAVAGGARGIDAFSAFVRSDAMMDVHRAQRALVDTDDGTIDGNDRTSSASGFGDGTVNMRDFRRFRDGLLQVEVEDSILSKTDVQLDGPADAPKRDLNLDRKIFPNGRRENLYPRFDFNGDGIVHRTRIPMDSHWRPNDDFRDATDFGVIADDAVWEVDAEDVSVAALADGGDAYPRPDPFMQATALRADRDGDGVVDYLRSVDLTLTLTFGTVTDDFAIRIISFDGTETRFSRLVRYLRPVCSPAQDEPPIPAGQTVKLVVTVPIYAGRKISILASGIDVTSCDPLATTGTVGSTEFATDLKFGQDLARTFVIP